MFGVWAFWFLVFGHFVFGVWAFWCLVIGRFDVWCSGVLGFSVRAFCFLVFGSFDFAVWAHWTDEMNLEYGDGELCSAK